MTETRLLSRPVELGTIGARSTMRSIEATAEERAAIAAALDLVEMSALTAEFELRRDGRNMVVVEGRVKADIVQRCIVSLAPVPQRIEEPVLRRFLQDGPDAVRPREKAAEIRVDPSEEDPPENLAGPVLDLGPIVMEHFVMAIDPYPKAPGAYLPSEADAGPSAAADSPFAVLARLARTKPGSR